MISKSSRVLQVPTYDTVLNYNTYFLRARNADASFSRSNVSLTSLCAPCSKTPFSSCETMSSKSFQMAGSECGAKISEDIRTNTAFHSPRYFVLFGYICELVCKCRHTPPLVILPIGMPEQVIHICTGPAWHVLSDDLVPILWI